MAPDVQPSNRPAPGALAAQVSRAVVWNTLFVPLRLVAEVLSTLVKLNLLSQAGYGLLALISGANNGLGTAIDMGTQRALPKYISELSRSSGPRAVLRLLTAVFAAQMAVLLVMAVGLASWLREPYLGTLREKIVADPKLSVLDQAQLLGLLGGYGWLVITAIIALLFLGICYDIFMAYLNSFFKQRTWNSITLAAGLLPQLLSVAAILILPNQWAILGVLGATVLAPTLAVALAGWQVIRLQIADLRLQIEQEKAAGSEKIAHQPGIRNLKSAIHNLKSAIPRGFVRYTAVSFLMTATDFVASAGFAIYLAGDIGDVAVLTAGAALAKMALGYLYTPMVGVQVPLFSRVRQGEGGTLNGAYQSLVRLQLLLFVPGGVGLMLLAQQALLVISPQYLVAAPIVWVLVPCLFLESLLTTAHNALIVYEKLGIIIVSRLLTLAAVALLALVLPPRFGLLGVALAFGLSRVAAGAWATGSGYRLLGLRWPWRFTARVLGATLAMSALILASRGLLPPLPAAAGLAVRLREAGLMFALATVGAVGFFVALRILGGLDVQDRAQLMKLKLPFKKWVAKLI
ncbi:MAG: polysaccharide biosynthesis C-terminal domain-containing protein [Chloroflexales bacterium]